MELAKIEILLEKYLEAKTTLDEEKTLKIYFSQNNVPEHLSAYKDLFSYFTENALDISDKKITIQPKNINMRWLSIAAAIVLFVSIFTLYQNDKTQKEEAKLAYIETQKALNLIAISLNKGELAMAQLQTFDNTKNKIFNNNSNK